MPVPILSLYMRPDEAWSLGATVTVLAGTLDSTYTAGWATDGIPTRPFKATNGTATIQLVKTGAEVGGIAICHHNIDAARAITIGGDLSAAMVSPAARPNGIPYNAFHLVDPPVTVDTLTVGVASNSAALIIGEVFAGKLREFPGGGLLINSLSGTTLRMGEAAGARSVRRYDPGEAARTWSSEVLCTPAELDDMLAWFEAQKNGSLPSLFIPDSDVNDAWVVELLAPAWSLDPNSQDIFHVTLTFEEVPRVRW